MAKVSDQPYPGDWELDFSNAYWQKKSEEQEKRLAAIIAAQPTPDNPSLVGACLRFPRGDGNAFYVVVKDRPLTIAHVPVGDAWQADECTLRGINAGYVRKRLRQDAAIRKMFAR
jgi:hypothetical protein